MTRPWLAHSHFPFRHVRATSKRTEGIFQAGIFAIRFDRVCSRVERLELGVTEVTIHDPAQAPTALTLNPESLVSSVYVDSSMDDIGLPCTSPSVGV